MSNLLENADLQEAHNKLCKIATKDAMIVYFSLKKIDSLELEKKNLLIKFFDTNELLNVVKVVNIPFLDWVKKLEIDSSVTREQLDWSFGSTLDDMLGTQKSSSGKTGFGYIKGGSSSRNSFTKFVNSSSEFTPTSIEKVHEEEILAT